MESFKNGMKVDIYKNINGEFKHYDTGEITQSVILPLINNVLGHEENEMQYVVKGKKERYEVIISKWKLDKYIIKQIHPEEYLRDKLDKLLVERSSLQMRLNEIDSSIDSIFLKLNDKSC